VAALEAPDEQLRDDHAGGCADHRVGEQRQLVERGEDARGSDAEQARDAGEGWFT